MASHTRNAWDMSADGRSSVASELEAIFAALPRPPATAEAPAPIRPANRRRGTRLRLWITLLGILALAALAGSLAFLVPVTHPRIAPPPPKKAVSRPVAAPGPAPLPLAAPPQVIPPKPAPARTPPREHKSAAPPRHRSCPRFASEAWCLHGRITSADRELRGAYAAAVRAGVDRHTLIDIRSDWKRLRGRANHDPQALIRGYALLTQELRAEVRRTHR